MKIQWKKIWRAMPPVLIFLLLVLLGFRLEELSNQLAYLQDSTSIILSDVSGLGTHIAQTLEEENSMVEKYNIEIVDTDFAAQTCRVEITVIPKEFTDSTTLTVYFGTQGYALIKDGFEYTGSATLPLDEDYAGNLTFLFADGKKKHTEVYSSFGGISGRFEQVLSGRIDKEPQYKDGVLVFDGSLEYLLDGVGLYEFDALELVAALGEEELFCRDLLAEDASEPEDPGDTEDGVAGTKAQELLPEADVYPVSGTDGTLPLVFSCQPKQEGLVRIFLRAVSLEGYRFEYDLLSCRVEKAPGESEEEPVFTLDEAGFEREGRYVVYDRHGGSQELMARGEQWNENHSRVGQ